MINKPYAKNRKAKSKEITQQIIDTIRVKEMVVVIEWVKGHEDMGEEESKHNWISMMKMKGNAWADQAARQVVKENIKDEEGGKGRKSKEKWSLQTREDGRQVDWVNLPKMMSLTLQKQRTLRLSKPTKAIFEHGQGMYMAQSREGRSLAFKTLKDRSIEGSQWHYAAIRFMMDKFITRDFQRRMYVKTGAKKCDSDNNECPVCWIKEGMIRIQTKEHILSGRCAGTRDLKLLKVRMLKSRMIQWGMNNNDTETLVNMLLREEEIIDYETHTLKSHSKAACLIGMWNNNTIMRGREFLADTLALPAETARLRIMTLMEIVQQVSLTIIKRVTFNRKIWMDNLNEPEKDTGKRRDLSFLGENVQNTDRRWIIKKEAWNLGKNWEKDYETWEGKAVIHDWARARNISEEEVKKEVFALTGKRKAEWNLDLRRYKAWKSSPYDQVVKLLYAGKRTKDGGRNLKRKIENEGEEGYVKHFKLEHPALESLIEECLQELCGPPPGGVLGTKFPVLATGLFSLV